MKAKAGSEGMVIVQAGSYGGLGWDGTAIDRWLGEFLESDQGKNKLSKLGRAQGAERHLVIVLAPFSPAGMGIPIALTAGHERGPANYAIPYVHDTGAAYPLVATSRLYGDAGGASLDA